MKDIIGYEDKYAVDEQGNVYSKNYHRSGKTKMLKAHPVSGGYLAVTLCKEGKKKTLMVHRLMAEVYLPDFCKELEVDHMDRDKLNNNLSNLRMVSKSQNQWNRSPKGYSYNKSMGKYQACIMKNNKQHYLGYFLKEEDARQAYLTAKETMHVI